MPRASKDQRALNHERVVERASQLVRERGSAGVSVAEVMAAAGLTPGGFYKHFASKDDLLARATEAAFADRLARLSRLAGTTGDRAATRAEFVSEYLTAAHRDHPGHGCAAAALAGDAGRRDGEDPVRGAYIAGVRAMAEVLQTLGAPEPAAPEPAEPAADGPDREPSEAAEESSRALADLATLVGALTIARATAGDEISDRVLAAARSRLLGS